MGDTDPRAGQGWPSKSRSRSWLGWCELGEFTRLLLLLQPAQICKQELIPAVRQAAEPSIKLCSSCSLLSKPSFSHLSCAPCALCPPSPSARAPPWLEMDRRDMSLPREHQTGHTKLGEPAEHRNSGENACLCESTRRQIVDIKLLGRLWDWAVPFSPHTKGPFLSRCKTEPY